MARPLWFVKLIEKTFPSRFVLARLTNWPVIGRLVDHWLFEDDDLVYLPQHQVIAVNESVAAPQSTVLPSQVVDYFVEEANYHWIMNRCICRQAEQCQDYPIELGCLFLGEAVLKINPKLGRLVSKEEAREHVRRCREAGLVHLIGRNKLDTVWLGVGPGDKLLTICNCCPCCCLWRMLPDIAPDIGAKVHAMPGVKVTVTDRCVGCGVCTEGICFVDAIHLEDGRAVHSDACRGCGRCVSVCPEGAIELSIEDDHFAQQMIERLSAQVDVS
jgi:NAD-dependent dihydropyrimidine dehydrogenase PreA subunit